MRKALYSILVTVILSVLIFTTAFAGDVVAPKIVAGKGKVGSDGYVGIVRVTGNPDGSLTLDFRLKRPEGFCITDAAVHTGLSLDDFPQNKGGAIPGQFDYKYDFGGCVFQVTKTIEDPAGEWGDFLYIAIHVNVYGPDGQQNTGWVVNCGKLEGGQFPGKNWSAFFRFPANAWFDE